MSIRKSIIRTIALAVCFLIVGSATALAASYSFSFTPPYYGCAKFSGTSVADGSFSPYVDPDGSSLETIYCLVTPSSKVGSITYASETTVSTGAKASMKYLPGYGGANQSYKLMGCPRYTDFLPYTVYGNWKP